jgi:hypothetical protein
VVLISLVESVVSAFHKDFCPLNKGGGQKTGEGANNHFLQKRGVHDASTAVTVPEGAFFVFPRSKSQFSARELRVFSAMVNPVQNQPVGGDAEQLSRLLELELIQKRTTWKQAKERKKSVRSLAVLFVFLLFAGCLLGFFFAYNRVNEERQSRPAATTSGR